MLMDLQKAITNNGTSDLEPEFKTLKERALPATEKIKFQTFWAMARKLIKEDDAPLPCDCAV